MPPSLMPLLRTPPMDLWLSTGCDELRLVLEKIEHNQYVAEHKISTKICKLQLGDSCDVLL